MKQLLIASSLGTKDVSANTAGKISFIDLATGEALSAAATKNFAIYCGQGDPTVVTPLCIPEVDIKTLAVVKQEKQAGSVFTATFTCPAVTANANRNQTMTVILSKKGTVFNERDKWSFMVVVEKGKALANTALAQKIADQINANAENLNVRATVSSAAVTVTGTSEAQDYAITFADDMSGVTTSALTQAVETTCDEKYVAKLYQECIAGRGVKYLEGDGKEIYPGYPEAIAAGEYVIYTLRFAVGRDAAKTRDERVSQLVHIAVLKSATAVVTAIEKVLGIPSASQTSD